MARVSQSDYNEIGQIHTLGLDHSSRTIYLRRRKRGGDRYTFY